MPPPEEPTTELSTLKQILNELKGMNERQARVEIQVEQQSESLEAIRSCMQTGRE